MAEHNILGKKGEDLAAALLIKKGYTIRDRNWVYAKAELDIIAECDEALVVVEVKTRSSEFEAEAHQTVTPRKQKLIIMAADKYLNDNQIEKEARFDIISVLYTDGLYTIEHLEDAFYPTI